MEAEGVHGAGGLEAAAVAAMHVGVRGKQPPVLGLGATCPFEREKLQTVQLLVPEKSAAAAAGAGGTGGVCGDDEDVDDDNAAAAAVGYYYATSMIA